MRQLNEQGGRRECLGGPVEILSCLLFPGPNKPKRHFLAAPFGHRSPPPPQASCLFMTGANFASGSICLFVHSPPLPLRKTALNPLYSQNVLLSPSPTCTPAACLQTGISKKTRRKKRSGTNTHRTHAHKHKHKTHRYPHKHIQDTRTNTNTHIPTTQQAQ